jgi:hypothetical protein
MKKLAIILFVLLAVISCQLLPEVATKNTTTYSLLADSTPRVILVAMFGQSNAGNLAPSKFNYKVAYNVKGFDWDYKIFVDSFSANEIRGHVFSPLILIADSMRKLNPTDMLHFVQFQQGGTNLDVHWNVNNTLSTSLFKKMCLTMDQALAQMPTPDETILFWVQGEDDSANAGMASRYYTNEVDLYDSLVSRYGVDKFYTYIPNSNAAYLNQVKTAKYNHASATNETVEIPTGNGNYQSSKVHMTPKGVYVFVDSVMKKMN